MPSNVIIGVNFLIPFLDREALIDAAGRSALVEFFLVLLIANWLRWCIAVARGRDGKSGP